MKHHWSARQIKGIEGSIKKWEGIVEGKIQDEGVSNCPLCKLYVENDCKRCPVMLTTGIDLCYKTPYYHFRSYSVDGHAYSLKGKALAQAELDFLKSLLD